MTDWFWVKPALTILAIPTFFGLTFLLVRCLNSIGGRDPLTPPDMAKGLAPAPLAQPARQTPRIGPYHILSRVGRGGMGTVFKGISPQGRPVAIKLIGGKGQGRRAGAAESARIGLVREARLAAELHHPNIVEIYDIGQENGTLYIVMEYLEGAPLDQRIRNQAVSVHEGLRIVVELCDALDYAHSRGVVHRDVKPANVFVMADGTVKILDFGLALTHDKLKSGPAAGTFPYMSPEQIDGRDVDHRSDIWSAGITLFEILTGTRPFNGENLFGLRRRIVGAGMPKLPSTLPLTHELEAVLEKALTKNREARYSSASEFSAALRSLLSRTQEAHTRGPMAISPVGFDRSPSTKPTDFAQRYTPVNLGFTEQFSGPVFVTQPHSKHQEPGFGESALVGIAGLLGLVALGGGIAARVLEGVWQLAALGLALGAIALLFVELIVAIVFHAVVKVFFPPKSLRCRSCSRKMRSVSVWARPAWLLEQRGFCVPDCIAALKEGLWEDAVKLLWVHTTAEQTDAQYKLEFMECRSCRDQRAYLSMENKAAKQWTPAWVSEAYKFRDSLNTHKSNKKPDYLPRIRSLFRNSSEDVHEQVTR